MSLYKPTVFQGAATALITPFHNGKPDTEALKILIERQIRDGISAILIGGTTGEAPCLSFEEHRLLLEQAHNCIGNRVPLLAGCGSNCTERACQLAKNACEAGADALLAVTPYYNKASDKGILLHYRELCRASSKPILVYSVPSRTGLKLNLNHYRELAKLDRIVGVKEASGDLELVEAICRDCSDSLDLYSGNDSQTVASMKLGASGVISVASNLLPKKMSQICSLCLAGEFRRAGKLQSDLAPLMEALFSEVNPIPVKYLASLMGLCDAEYRLPLCMPSPKTRVLLEKFLPSLME